MAKNEIFTEGTCRFCAQRQAVNPCDTQEAADAIASGLCNCDEGQMLGKRERTLQNAKNDIEVMFGEAAENLGEISLPESQRGMLYDMAVLLYDQHWRSVNIIIDQGFKAKLSVTDKGKLTIQRVDSKTRKREHS